MNARRAYARRNASQLSAMRKALFLVRDVGVGGSNPLIPTNQINELATIRPSPDGPTGTQLARKTASGRGCSSVCNVAIGTACESTARHRPMAVPASRSTLTIRFCSFESASPSRQALSQFNGKASVVFPYRRRGRVLLKRIEPNSGGPRISHRCSKSTARLVTAPVGS